MIKKLAFALLVVATFACVGSAQDHPNFAGTWKLNLAKSNPGDYGPSARTEVITQDGSKFTDKITSSSQMGDSEYTLTFTADGTKVTVAPDSPQANLGQLTMKDIAASWDGASLVLAMDMSFQQQMDLAAKYTYSLSADGKTLTVANHISTGQMGDFDTTLVFDKQ
jgi:hypothetical protein